MSNPETSSRLSRHLRVEAPSPWVCRFAHLVPEGGASRGTVLDLACGGGRHARHFLDLGRPVVALDREVGPISDLAGHPRAEIVEADLEKGAPVFEGEGPLAGRVFAGIVVVNYLHRPLLPALLDALEPGGVFIYETFARGNERFTRPRNPDHLLRDGELLEVAAGRLQVIAYEKGIETEGPLPGVVQRICAVDDRGTAPGGDGEPEPRPLRPRQPSKEEP